MKERMEKIKGISKSIITFIASIDAYDRLVIVALCFIGFGLTNIYNINIAVLVVGIIILVLSNMLYLISKKK